MTREEFSKLVKGMKAVYPQPTFLPDKDAFNVWYALLQDIPYKTLSVAVQKHMMQSKFAPTIAELREQCTTTTSTETTEAEAWDMVYKAICNSGYNAAEEFDKLPKEIQRAIGSANQLRAWALDEDFNAGVESSNFKKLYRSITSEKKQEALLSPEIKQAIASLSEKMMLEGEQ